MNKNKISPLLILLVFVGLIYILNPARLIPSIFKLRLKGLGVAAGLVCATVIAVVYFAFKQSKPEKDKEEQLLTDRMNTKGRQRVVQLRSLGMNIKNAEIRQRTEEICKAVEKILQLTRDSTDKAIQADRFIENYLVTLGSVLTKYARLETNKNLTDEVSANAVECLKKIKTAADNQYGSFVQNDIMDISAEMETLLAMCRRDGLLAEEGFSFETEAEGVRLVL